MKKSLLGLCVLLVHGTASAAPVTIADNYIGGTPNSSSYVGQDIIGDANFFSVSQMIVDISGGTLSVSIDSSYFDNVGKYYTDLGDLFISTDGWTPFGTAPYVNDTASNGEDWEYAVVLQRTPAPTNGSTINMLGSSGVAQLFQIPSNSSIILSSAPSGYIYRANQEVQLNTSGLNAVALGSWSISDLVGNHDRLTIDIPLSALQGLGDSIGLRWSMTCANDAIEGSAAVPEPMTLGLLALGLGGALRRKGRAS